MPKKLSIIFDGKSKLVAGSIEISDQLISDLIDFVEVAGEHINANVIKKCQSINLASSAGSRECRN